MLTDFQLLGIEETSDTALIKSAYRKRMKELHPDMTREEESFGKHTLLVSINQAYKRLMNTGSREIRVKAMPASGKSTDAIIAHSDPAYVYYKAALSFYMKIHPSEWDFEKSGMLNIKISEDNREQELMREKIMALVSLFPKAYYYFSIVVHEYPESIWVLDAQDKMSKIEKRTKLYKKIIDSFSTWNVDRKTQKEKYKEQFDKHKKTRDSFDPESEKRWKT
ncbi:MAG: DnaJ domain-containing protein [Treponemataceae bacterium]